MNRKREKALEYYNSGKKLRKLGKFDEAIKNLKKAKYINYKLGEKSIEAATSEELGYIYRDLAQYKNALNFANEALTIFKEIGHSAAEGNGYLSLGNIYSLLGRFSEAIYYQKKACEIFLRNGEQDFAGTAYANLCHCYYLNGEYEKALKCVKQALKIANKTDNLLQAYNSFLNMGNAYFGLFKFTEAIENCEKSFAICTKQKRETECLICEANCYMLMGKTYGILGKGEEGITYYEKCIKIYEKLQNYNHLALACANFGQFYIRTRFHPTRLQETLENSIKYLKLAINIMNKHFVDLTGTVDKNKTSFCDQFFLWHVCLMFPYHLMGRSEAALLVLDLGKSKVLRMLIKQRQNSSPTQTTGGHIDESWISIEDGTEKERLRELSKEIQLKKFHSTLVVYVFDNDHKLIIWLLNHTGIVIVLSWTPDDAFSTAFATLQECISPLLATVSVRVPREYSFFNQVSSSITELQTEQIKRERAPLHDKAANVTTNDTETSPPEKPVSNASSTSENLQPTASDNKVELEDDKQARAPKPSEKNIHQNQMSHGNTGLPNLNDSTQILSYLYQALVGPVKDVITGTKLIIVPHGCLFFVPFSSLIDENGCYLSEKYQVQITPSVHTLASSMKDVESNEIGISLFVGNPEIGEVSFEGRDIQPSSLPAATKEVEYLASLFGAKPLVEADATKERVIQLMRNATIVHIAAHGHEKNGDILLAPNSVNPKRDVPPDEENYLLTQSDILDTKLAARLVVLSCCHSGRGETSSEGVLGIARSFMGAGARSVLVALWRIHDEATQEFMEHFYAKLCQGTFVCQAMKETINIFQQHEQYNSFIYWAPFTILGEDVKFTKKEIDEIRIRNNQTFD